MQEYTVLRNVSQKGLDDIWVFVSELFQQDFSAQHRFGIEIKKLCVCGGPAVAGLSDVTLLWVRPSAVRLSVHYVKH